MKSIILGITGSIAVGKSTVTKYIADLGIPTLQSDKIVDDILLNDQQVIEMLGELLPGEGIDKQQLRNYAIDHIQELEKIIHPAVIKQYHNFINENKSADLVVIEIPLLYEVRLDKLCDYVLVIHCSAKEQYDRVLQRPGMTPELLQALLQRQMPEAEKIKRADFVISTDGSWETTKAQIDAVLEQI